MTQSSSGALPLRDNQDIVVCRQTVRRIARDLQFGLTGETMLVTAASELARNTLIYGGGGGCLYEVVEEGSRVGIRLVFVDHGPGIADVGLAMTDGWTSGAGLGLGLGGASRLVHQFQILSRKGEGTRVSILRWK
jgi:serine/threonine-protein kinase RsbT